MEEATRCAICNRTPLVGEEATVLADQRTESVVCDLCLATPRAESLGEAVRRERVRSAEGAANVRRIYPTPVAPSPAPVGVTAPAGTTR